MRARARESERASARASERSKQHQKKKARAREKERERGANNNKCAVGAVGECHVARVARIVDVGGWQGKGRRAHGPSGSRDVALIISEFCCQLLKPQPPAIREASMWYLKVLHPTPKGRCQIAEGDVGTRAQGRRSGRAHEPKLVKHKKIEKKNPGCS